ncbi:MAG: glycosyltransferase, partial [Proteobacteria bacterium]|nr:glycosyltransferase [Pseudomonadota bacterium]
MIHRENKEAIAVLHARTVIGCGGGADKTTLKSPQYLRGSRYHAWAAFLYPPGDSGFAEIQRRAKKWACPLLPISDRGPVDLRVLWRLVVLCRRHEIGVWHSHEYKTNAIGFLLRPFLRFHLVTTVHGWVEHSPKLFLYYTVDRWVLRRFDRVVAVSKDIFQACLDMGVRPERLRLIENAIEPADYRRQGLASRAPGRIGVPARLLTGRVVPEGRLVIGAVGRLSPEKGFYLLIEAVSCLCAAGLDLELWIAGEGPQEATLRQAIDKTGCRDRIRLLGFCSDTVALFECFDIFCLPSLREGLPNVVLEAMAMEVPILATRCGGIEAALRDGEDSHLIPPGSVDAL